MAKKQITDKFEKPRVLVIKPRAGEKPRLNREKTAGRRKTAA
jgi:hypothetical protein